MAQGSIRKRTLDGGRARWDVIVDLGPDPVTGKRRQRKRTYATRKEAQAGFAAWLTDIDKGTAVDRSVRRFLEVAEADGYSPLWLLAVRTGMRRGELLGLRWEDVDLPAAALQVRQAVTRYRNGWRITEPKTASGRRTIALDADCVAALRMHRVRQNARRLALGDARQDYDLVFASEVGTPLDPNNVYHRFGRLAARAGLPRIPFQGLRHSHATLLMKQGVHPKVASERLGHANISITLQIYSHVQPVMQREAADIFAAALAEGTS